MLLTVLSGLAVAQTEGYDAHAEADADVGGGGATVHAEVILGHQAPWAIRTQVASEGDAAGDWLLHVTGSTEVDLRALTATFASADGSLPTDAGATQTLTHSWLAGEGLDLEFAMAPLASDHGAALLRVHSDEADYGFEHLYSVKADRVAPGAVLVNITRLATVCCSDGSGSDEFTWPATPDDLATAPEDSLSDGDPIAEDEDGTPDPFGGGFSIQSTTNINGYIYITKPGSTTTVPCRLCKVKVYDDDSTSGNEYLGSAIASYAGYFSLTTSNDDAWAGQDPYLVIELDYPSAPAKLMNAAGAFYTHQTGVLKKDCPNTSCSVTNTLSLSGDKQYAFWAWEAMMRAWNTWNNAGYGVPKVNVEYPAAVTTAVTEYANSKIRLPSNEGGNQFTHAHEYGHWAMYKAQNSYLAPGSCTTGLNQQGNIGCAWREGFADFSALVVFNTNRVTFYDGSYINMETATCSAGCTVANGPTVPIRVTATMNDLWDTAADGTQDTSAVAYSFTTILGRLRAGTPTGIADYFNLWKTQGTTQETHFRNVASQNTITV